VAIKLSYMEDVRQAVRARLATLPGPELDGDIVAAATARGEALLEAGLEAHDLAAPETGTLRERLESAAALVMEDLESGMELTGRGSLLDRVRAIRRKVHQIRMDAESAASCPEVDAWASGAILALRILSYTGDYLQGTPSLDRVAESVEKLAEDHTGERQAPIGKRQAFVCFGNPLYVADFATTGRSRDIVQQITSQVEDAVTAGIESINRNNLQPGGKPWLESPTG
jgi:hypothetical protein